MSSVEPLGLCVDIPIDLKTRRRVSDAVYRVLNRGRVLAGKKRYRKAHKEKGVESFKRWWKRNRYKKATKEAHERLAAGVKPRLFPTPQEALLRRLERSVGVWGAVPKGVGGAKERYRARGGRRKEKAARRAAKLQATPAWANRKEIARIYAEARHNGMTVDHIVPLKSKFVCGLHVEANLRLLPMLENSKKSNIDWPGKWN